jgi:hypothetical protein
MTPRDQEIVEHHVVVGCAADPHHITIEPMYAGLHTSPW